MMDIADKLEIATCQKSLFFSREIVRNQKLLSGAALWGRAAAIIH